MEHYWRLSSLYENQVQTFQSNSFSFQNITAVEYLFMLFGE